VGAVVAVTAVMAATNYICADPLQIANLNTCHLTTNNIENHKICDLLWDFELLRGNLLHGLIFFRFDSLTANTQI